MASIDKKTVYRLLGTETRLSGRPISRVKLRAGGCRLQGLLFLIHYSLKLVAYSLFEFCYKPTAES
jgi:hypothetical protein